LQGSSKEVVNCKEIARNVQERNLLFVVYDVVREIDVIVVLSDIHTLIISLISFL